MERRGCTAEEADRLLARNGGFVKAALADARP